MGADGAGPDQGPTLDRRSTGEAHCACTIEGRCHGALARHDQDPCRMCDPAVSTAQWSAAPGCVVTLAGTGDSAYADGAALSAAFTDPIAVAVDSAGRVFVADWSINRVRRIWHGTVTTVAGNGSAGHVDGPAAGAELDAPMGLAVGGNGLYISEKNGNRIRLHHSGQVGTVAGDGSEGITDGPALQASFAGPQGLTVAQDGAVHVADWGNHRIRRILDGVVSTLCGGVKGWGDGSLSEARLAFPTAVETDPAGGLIIADEGNNVIRRIAGGQVTTLAGVPGEGGFADGPAGSARFSGPYDIAVDAAGAVYVADCGNSRVRKIEDGQVTTIAGDQFGFVDGELASARFACPLGLDLDGSGHLYVIDGYNERVRVINLGP